MHDIPLNDTQRIFADKNHNLVYKFLHEKNLPASEYYDIVIFGYLRAVQRYLTDPNLSGYSFATVAWRAMEGEVVNTHRTDKRRFRVIRFVRSRQSYTGHLTRRSTPTVTDEEALRESEVALLLHTLAKRVTPQQMEIIRLRTKGYQTNEIAQMQNTSLYHVNTLLDNARFIVVELCRDAKGRQGQNEKAEAGTLHYRQTHVRTDGGQTRHLQYGRRDVPYGSCSEDSRKRNAGDSL